MLTASVSFRPDFSDDKPEEGFESCRSNDRIDFKGLVRGSKNTLQALENLGNAMGHAQMHKKEECVATFSPFYISALTSLVGKSLNFAK